MSQTNEQVLYGCSSWQNGCVSTEKRFKSCREYRDPFVWSQSINSRKAIISGIAPVETYNNRFIITISGGGYPFKNFQTWLKLNLLGTRRAINLCVCVFCGNKSGFLIPDKINRFFCGNMHNDFYVKTDTLMTICCCYTWFYRGEQFCSSQLWIVSNSLTECDEMWKTIDR